MAAHTIHTRSNYPVSVPYLQQIPQQKPVRVDPFAPLPTSLGPPQNADNPSWPEEVQRNSVVTPEAPTNDAARSTSRKRRVSGTGSGPRRSQVASYPQPPAPQIVRAPPAPYQGPSATTGGVSQVSNPTSFAARARGLSDNEESTPADVHPDPEPAAQSVKPRRRESSRRTREQVRSSQLGPDDGRGISRLSSMQDGVSIQQPRIVNMPAQRHVVEPKAIASGEQPSVSEPYNDVVSPPVRSNTRKSSAGQADTRKEWAPDRSPLQKLEVKLNDISKEEKRARVEKAEQRLRESKAKDEHRRADLDTQPAGDRASSQYASARHSSKDEPPLEQTRQGAYGRRDEDHPRKSAAPAYIEDIDRQQLERNQASPHDQKSLDPAVPPSRKARSRVSDQQPPQPIPTDSDLDQQGGRAVRFHGQEDNRHSPTDPGSRVAQETRNLLKESGQSAGPKERLRKDQLTMGARTSKEVPNQQQALYSGRTERSGNTEDPTAYGGAPDPVPGKSVRSQSNAVKYTIPPQTAAGIDARQKVGFDSDPEGVTEAPAHHKHHLSDILHHSRKNAPNSSLQLEPQSRHLDEWRQGGTARLTAADVLIGTDDSTDQNAWWERGKSGASKTSGGAQSQRNPGIKSVGYAEDYGQETRSFDPPLYLKCGPLLRYTGLKRDKLQASRIRGNVSTTERESWRGSVMIVTVDGGSDYSIPPTLRLFPEPIELLPPPPQQVDGESGHSLPSEYIDPIAGLPKLSRTGKTIYVKPVEDLEQEVDLSRVETDDGLFEETRTAAVPTSYGKPDPRLSQSQQSDSKKQRLFGKTKSKSQSVRGVRLHAERGVTFWRFNLEVELSTQQTRIAYSINNSPSVGFWVPAKGQSMNVMFHSCNGFSMSVK